MVKNENKCSSLRYHIQLWNKRSDEMNVEYLNELKARGNWTISKLSEVSNVPVSTLSRLFRGQSVNLDSVAAVMRAMDGSLDRLMDLAPAPEPELLPDAMRELYETALQRNTEHLQEAQRWSRQCFCAFCVAGLLIVCILSILVFDVIHPGMGWIR